MNKISEISCSKVLEELLHTGRTVGRTGKSFDGLGALSSVNNLLTLRRMMLDLKPERTLEVGLSVGGSCLIFAVSHRDLRRAPSGQHYALDPFQSSVWDDAGLVAIEREGLSDYISYKPEYSRAALPRLLAEQQKFGFIYIDGSHVFEDVFVDTYYSIRPLSSYGVILFDDCASPHIAKVLAFLRSNLQGHVDEIDLAPYRSRDEVGLKYKLACLMGRRQLRGFRLIGPLEREWNVAFRDF